VKARTFRGLHRIHQYQVGDLLLEADRIVPAAPVMLSTRGIPAAKVGDETVDSFLSKIKAQSEDYPALKEVLQFLKFSPEDVEAYYESISTTIKITAGCVTIVGAVITVVHLVDELFGPDKEAKSLSYLKHIAQRVDQIYGYLAANDRRGLYDDTVEWRGNLENVRNAVKNSRASRSPLNLKALVDLKTPLDSNLLKMLDPRNGDIAFQRVTYGYSAGYAGTTDTGHWIDCAVSPFMTLTDGKSINYRDPANELQAPIWDPGHYVDMLAGCLTDRMLLVAVTEPAFRSTNYDRLALENLLAGLTAFLNKWRASLIVANPLIGLNGGGHLQHPNSQAPMGIPIGAVDPVTGISFFNSFWLESDWGWVATYEGSIEAKGEADYSDIKNPALAYKRAINLQPRLLEAAIRASGIGHFAELRARLQDVLARYTTGSDFVDLPNATFNLIQMNGPAAQIETVNLGFIGKYSKHPDKQYQGTRYTQIVEKRFRFAMPLRAEVSLIQLGYRIEIANRSIPLIPFSVAPGDGSPVARFPTQPISQEIRIDDWLIYDVYQSSLFSEADEDRFEGVNPPSGPAILIQTRAFPGERIFLNERRGPIALKVDVTFETDYNNPAQPFVGHANVTIRNIDPVAYPGGIILPIAVYETRVGLNNDPEEVPADSMTIHIAPSFLVVGREYFTDRREGLETMNQIFGGLSEKYAISVQPGLPIGPEWQVRRRAVEEVAKDQAIRRLLDAEPEVTQAVVRRFMLPTPVRSHHG
jgi:hypothetical protein